MVHVAYAFPWRLRRFRSFYPIDRSAKTVPSCGYLGCNSDEWTQPTVFTSRNSQWSHYEKSKRREDGTCTWSFEKVYSIVEIVPRAALFCRNFSTRVDCVSSSRSELRSTCP